MSELAQYRGTGKRKTSVARVILRPGDGTTWFNGRTLDDYFPRLSAPRAGARAAQGRRCSKARTTSASACTAAARRGQAGAVRHGIARALVEADPELRSVSSARASSRATRGIVERKKAGLHKARKAPQFSKR